MPILRLAYATQFLLALIAVFLLWSQVGGQSHLDLMPWYLKLCLGGGAAYAAVRATMAAVSRDAAWNGGTLKWCGILLALLIGCGLATFYVHNNLEDDETDTEEQPAVSQLLGRDFPHSAGGPLQIRTAGRFTV
jgi:hypothetical protein